MTMEVELELTTMPVEVAPLRLALLKLIVMVSVRLYERLVKLATPLAAVTFVVPCNIPVPAPRAAVTIVLLSEVPFAAFRTLPN